MDMPPQPGYPRASAALAAIGLTVQVAAAATDGVPVVKQILGVVLRIVTLVEKFEKDRDVLHSLADRARRTAQKLQAVLSRHEPGAEIADSLENIHGALRSIETWLEKHAQKSRLRKVLGYIYTVSRDVDRLAQDLQSAVEDFMASRLGTLEAL
ncbi:hypothetical protein AURDEDRAFT_164159 [Auricularia subglabra TFB-10046 SS5]|nr:hypothetical protein AURDEDRAFT_164159 [Auricularia subglabra TFB-10046 SS5]